MKCSKAPNCLLLTWLLITLIEEEFNKIQLSKIKVMGIMGLHRD